jgi:carbamate kinase
MTQATQERNAAAAADVIAGLSRSHQVVVTHGNGPQIGLLALTGEARPQVEPYGLDVLGAESQGMIGFLLETALRGALPNTPLATLLTSVLVDAEDAAFAHPTKPIGPVYSEDLARTIARDRGWQIAADGPGYRRVVPSPRPLQVLELPAIKALLAAGVMPICAGGGGVPVVRRPDGRLAGVEGVVDKDATSALLAELIAADRLLLLTDVPNIEINWRTPEAKPLHDTTAAELRRYTFEAGTMAPKVDAACRFVERTGRMAAIGAIEDAERIMQGKAGTRVWPAEAR